MTRREIIDFCLTFPAAYEDYPFDGIADPGAWTVMRHGGNRKPFVLVYERGGTRILGALPLRKKAFGCVVVHSPLPNEKTRGTIGARRKKAAVRQENPASGRGAIPHRR